MQKNFIRQIYLVSNDTRSWYKYFAVAEKIRNYAKIDNADYFSSQAN